MRVLEGKSVFSGIAIGKISILQKADTSVKQYEGRKSGGRDHTCAGSKRESS